MDKRQRFFAGDIFAVKGSHMFFIAKKSSSGDWIVLRTSDPTQLEHYANIKAISIHKCTAISLFFNEIVEKDLVFDELNFINPKGGKDVAF